MDAPDGNRHGEPRGILTVTDHPSPDLLRRFASSDLAAGEADAIAAHLRRGCARCRSEVELHLPPELAQAAAPAGSAEIGGTAEAAGAATAAEPAASPPAPLDAYDRAIEAALASVRLHGTAAVEVRRRTHQILAELRAGDTPELPPPSLDATPPLRGPRLQRGSAGAAGAGGGAAMATAATAAPRRFPLFDAALRYSWELRQDDPARMIELARFATRLAPTLGEDEIGRASCRERV